MRKTALIIVESGSQINKNEHEDGGSLRNFPDKFPIDYAIVVQLYKTSGKELLLSDYEREFLDQEICSFLNKNPLTGENLELRFVYVSMEKYGKKLFSFPVLDIDERFWLDANSPVHSLQKMISDSKLNIDLDNYVIFNLISYPQLYETPLFYKFNLIKNGERSESCPYLNEVYEKNLSIRRCLLEVNRLYYDLCGGEQKIEKAREKQKISGNVMDIECPGSNIWSIFRRKNAPALISKLITKEAKLEIKKTKTGQNHPRTKIQVVFCSNWESLFLEEIIQLARVGRYCFNCKKLLPGNYLGKYCQANLECKRGRDRVRKKKQFSQN